MCRDRGERREIRRQMTGEYCSGHARRADRIERLAFRQSRFRSAKPRSLPRCGGGLERGGGCAPEAQIGSFRRGLSISECWVPPSPPSPTRGEGAENHHVVVMPYRAGCVNSIAHKGGKSRAEFRDNVSNSRRRQRLKTPGLKTRCVRFAGRNRATGRTSVQHPHAVRVGRSYPQAPRPGRARQGPGPLFAASRQTRFGRQDRPARGSGNRTTPDAGPWPGPARHALHPRIRAVALRPNAAIPAIATCPRPAGR